jgi:hypothetical protein
MFFTIGSLMTFFLGYWNIIYTQSNNPSFSKIMCKMYVSNIVVTSTNDNVHCNVCGAKTNIKKVGFLQASIAPTIGDPIFFTIEGKCLEVEVGMPKVDFLVQPHPKQV